MAGLRLRIDEAAAERKAPRFSPAGQSTQMIVGADGATDQTILATSTSLYASYGLKRVYYSAFSPIPDTSAALPARPAPLMREHRLYQADWLYRFYGFATDELFARDGMLDLAIDPKLAWALRNPQRFPVDVNTAERELLLRVPGLGKRTVDRLVTARRHATLRFADVTRLAGSAAKLARFIVTPDHRPAREAVHAPVPAQQLSLFA
jgi:predicted DNA-binding helix-hairpin-helix protein